jgi:hypothetical protein
MNGNAVINYFVTQRGAGEKRTKFKRSLGIIVAAICIWDWGTGLWWTIGRVSGRRAPGGAKRRRASVGWVSGGGRHSRKGVQGIAPESFLNLQMQNPAFWRILTSKTIH